MTLTLRQNKAKSAFKKNNWQILHPYNMYMVSKPQTFTFIDEYKTRGNDFKCANCVALYLYFLVMLVCIVSVVCNDINSKYILPFHSKNNHY